MSPHNMQLTGICVSTGPPRFSAATSHEQNDVYMQDFDKAYAELEALSMGNRYVVFVRKYRMRGLGYS